MYGTFVTLKLITCLLPLVKSFTQEFHRSLKQMKTTRLHLAFDHDEGTRAIIYLQQGYDEVLTSYATITHKKHEVFTELDCRGEERKGSSKSEVKSVVFKYHEEACKSCLHQVTLLCKSAEV